MSEVLAVYRSASNPDKEYTIRLGKDGVVYCDCPGWKFSKPHRCGHLVDYEQGGGVSIRNPKPVIPITKPIPLTEADDIIQRIKTGVWK